MAIHSRLTGYPDDAPVVDFEMSRCFAAEANMFWYCWNILSLQFSVADVDWLLCVVLCVCFVVNTQSTVLCEVWECQNKTNTPASAFFNSTVQLFKVEKVYNLQDKAVLQKRLAAQHAQAALATPTGDERMSNMRTLVYFKVHRMHRRQQYPPWLHRMWRVWTPQQRAMRFRKGGLGMLRVRCSHCSRLQRLRTTAEQVSTDTLVSSVERVKSNWTFRVRLGKTKDKHISEHGWVLSVSLFIFQSQLSPI